MSESAASPIPQPIPEPLADPRGSFESHPGAIEGCVLLPERLDIKRSTESVRQNFLNHLHFTLARDRYSLSGRPLLFALCYTIRDHLVKNWMETQRHYHHTDRKRVYYLSMEFLIGRSLLNALINLEMYPEAKQAMEDIGVDLDHLLDVEWDAGLGNGGLGRLAACYLDAMATHKIAAHGYGLRYDYGIFYQQIVDGFQIEKPDNWLRFGNPWEFTRHEHLFPVKFNGRVQAVDDGQGHVRYEWVDFDEVMALAVDTPTPGYANGCVNTMRLWVAKASRGFNFEYFNHGDYMQAVADRALSENITSVLYPNDTSAQGRELRLKQEYFLVSSSLQDILRRFRKSHQDLHRMPEKVAIQLNDTHPSLAIPELMRVLMDEDLLSWEDAWKITTQVMAYTNHTILPEALERWSVDLLGRLLPRHLQIIFEINRRWLEQVEARWPGDGLRRQRMSIVEESPERRVNMARLSIVGSHAVNGVSQLHGEILKDDTFRDFYEMFPDRFTAITNGITPRLWLKACNPKLSHLIESHLGKRWIIHLDDLHRLEPLAEDATFREHWAAIRRSCKQQLSQHLVGDLHLRPFDPDSIVDVQIKRIHEYKRQTLNILHVIHRYRQLLEGHPGAPTIPRTVLFAGKAAPGYATAKLIIRLITAVGETIDRDPKISKLLNVQFLPNYSVSLAQAICPAADLSEQISTAGMEASGTGNMKLSLNGALTIGTLDGANIEIRDQVGHEHFFLFGHTTQELQKLRASGYHPGDIIQNHPELRATLDLIRSGHFTPHDPDLFRPLVDALCHEDHYFVCADFDAYVQAQAEVERTYADQDLWVKKSILNTARMGWFSSDRAIREYAERIWKVQLD